MGLINTRFKLYISKLLHEPQ